MYRKIHNPLEEQSSWNSGWRYGLLWGAAVTVVCLVGGIVFVALSVIGVK